LGAQRFPLGLLALFLGPLLCEFLGADFFIEGGLLERFATRVELAGGEIAKACAASLTAGTAGATACLFFLTTGPGNRPTLLAFDDDHVLAAVAEALLDVPRGFGALQAQRLACAGPLGLVPGFFGLTHA
jgi:hypothetical protein